MSLVDPPAYANPSRAEVRRLVEALLVADSDLNGFVYDHFPEVLQRFRPGLAWSAKLDLLVEHADPSELLRRLRERGLHGRRRRGSEATDFTQERARNSELLGSSELLAALVKGCSRDGWLVLSGPPGVGKTTLLTHLLRREEERTGKAVPHHFLCRTISDTARPGVVLRSLSAQLEARFPALADLDAPPELRLIELLGRIAQRGLGAGERLLLLVDGLDEAESEGLSNPLPRFLPPKLPAGVTLVCSTQPDHAYYGWLMDHAARQLAGHIDLSSPSGRESSAAACRAFWQHHGPPLGLTADKLDKAVACAQGCILHAVKLREILEHAGPRASALPLATGLAGLLKQLWDSLPATVQAGLGLLCAARQALPLPLLEELLGWKAADGDTAAFVRLARPFVYIEPAPLTTSVPVDSARLCHPALQRFIEEQLGPTALHQNHRQIAAALCSWPPLEDSLYAFRRLYALRHAVTQHIETEAVSQTEQLIGSIDYLVAKCQELGSAALAEDLEHAAARCAVPESARTFSTIAQALRLGAHWLHQDPGALPGLLYNLLRCANWPAASIERVLHYPPGRLRFRLRHPLQRRDTSVHTFAGHLDSVVACAVTKDSKRLISVSLDQTLRLWDLNSGALLIHFYGFAGTANSFALTPDGQGLLYAAEDQTVVLCSLATGVQQLQLRGRTGKAVGLTISPDGQLAIAAGSDSTLHVWKLATGELIHTLLGHTAQASMLAVSRDSRTLWSGSWDHTVRAWDLRTGRCTLTLRGHSGAVSSLCPTPDGKQLITASWDHSLRVWDLNSGVQKRVLAGHAAPVNACVLSSDGKLAISASDDHTVRIWDVANGRELRTMAEHSAAVKSCALGPDGKTVISLSDDCTLRQWDVATGVALRTFTGHIAAVTSCVVAQDGRQLLSGSEDRSLKLWDLSTEPDTNRAAGHIDAVTSLWLSPDGMELITGSEDYTLKVWDLVEGTVSRTFTHSEAVTACAGILEGRHVVSAAADRSVTIFDTQNGAELLRFSTSASTSGEFAAQPGAPLAFPSDDHLIELWGMPLDRQRSGDESSRARVQSCAVTLDGKQLLTAAADKLVRMWDLRTGAEILRCIGHTGAVTSLAVLPNKRRLVTGSSDATLAMWDLSTGEDLMRFFGHSGPVSACAVSPDGKRMLSGSHDKSLRLWDLGTGAEQLRLSGHIAPVTACAFTGDGKRAVSAALDYTLKLWELHSGMCVETIYGSSPFLCVTAGADWVCAGDQAGNVWMLRDQAASAPVPEAPPSRQSLVDSIRKLLRI